MTTTPINPQDETADYEATVSSLIELGSQNGSVITSTNPWRSDAYLLYSDPLVTLEKLITMRRSDGMARALANLVTLPIKLALQQGKWVAPEFGGGEEEVEFANLMWSLPPASGGMTSPADQIIDQILLSVFDGYAAFELVSQVPTTGPLKNKKTIRKLAYRDPRTLVLLQDEKGGYAGFRQNLRLPNGKILDKTLSPAKTVLFTVNGHENPLYGVSFFETCYPHYESKMRMYYMAEMAAQFAAIPGRVGTIPRSAKTQEVVAFRQALENMYFNTTILMKEGWSVTPFSSNSNFAFLPVIEHHNLMMAKSVLGSFMESEQRTVLVENSTQDASADLFLLSMETLSNQFAAILTNHLMPKYIKENFKNSTAFPVFKPGPLSDSVRRKITSMFEKVAISGILNTTPEFVRELEKHVADELGLDIDYADIESREEEAAIQASQQAEMVAEQAQQETLDQERAAEGGVPNSPTPTSGGTPKLQDMSAQDMAATENLDEDEVELTANDIIAMNQLMEAANRLFEQAPIESHSVTEGFSALRSVQ